VVQFWEYVKETVGEGSETEGLKRVRELLAPFVLRRVKSDVLDQLTAKRTEVSVAGI